MNNLIVFLSQRSFAAFVFSIVLQISILILVAILVARCLRFRAAAAEWVLRCTLYGILLCPLINAVWWSSDVRLISISVTFGPPVEPLTDGEPTVPEDPLLAKNSIGTSGDPAAANVTPSSDDPVDWPPESSRSAVRQRRAAPLTGVSHEPAMTFEEQAAFFMLSLWLVGATFGVAKIFLGWLKVHRLTKKAQIAQCPRVRSAYDLCSGLLPANRSVKVGVSREVSAPVVAGILNPMVLLPAEMTVQLDADELEMVLMHELAHVVRNDNRCLLLQRIASVLWWFNPLVHLLNRRLTQAREEVCDNYVLSQADGISYGEMLLRLARHSTSANEPSMAIGFWGVRWNLEQRISGILHNRRKTMTRVSTISMTMVVAVALTLIVVVAGTGVDAQTRTPRPSKVGDKTARRPVDPGYQVTDDMVRSRRIRHSNLTSQRNDSRINQATTSGPYTETTANPNSLYIPRLKRTVDKLRSVQHEFQLQIPRLQPEERKLAKQLADGIESLLSKVTRFKRRQRLLELESQMKKLKAEIDKLRRADATDGRTSQGNEPLTDGDDTGVPATNSIKPPRGSESGADDSPVKARP